MTKRIRFSTIAGGKIKRIRNRFGESGHHFELSCDQNTRRSKLEAIASRDANHQLLDTKVDYDTATADAIQSPFIYNADGSRLGYITPGNCFVMY